MELEPCVCTSGEITPRLFYGLCAGPCADGGLHWRLMGMIATGDRACMMLHADLQLDLVIHAKRVAGAQLWGGSESGLLCHAGAFDITWEYK